MQLDSKIRRISCNRELYHWWTRWRRCKIRAAIWHAISQRQYKEAANFVIEPWYTYWHYVTRGNTVERLKAPAREPSMNRPGTGA